MNSIEGGETRWISRKHKLTKEYPIFFIRTFIGKSYITVNFQLAIPTFRNLRLEFTFLFLFHYHIHKQ